MKKVIRIGTVKEYINRGREVKADVFCKIKFKEGKLSISGVIGPKSDGDCVGSCGQINMSLKPEDVIPAKGWTNEMITQFLNIWDEWHLNDMVAGSPTQENELKKHTFPGYPVTYYNWACSVLTAANLQPDANYLHNNKPYKYGAAWLKKEVPSEVLDFLESLPLTDKTPAWV